MKELLASCLVFLLVLKSQGQIQNPLVRKADVPHCEIMQIGLTDSATHVFFKYTAPSQYEKGGWICAGDGFYIKDNQSGRKYRMLNSLNIPICPSKEVFDSSSQVHYFSLSFQPLPLDAKEIDIIESPEGGFNFYGVSLIQDRPADHTIDYVQLLEDTPVKEAGSFMKDGKAVQYFVHNGFVITMHLAIETTYGKYYTAYISIENHSERRVDFDPEDITAVIYDKAAEIPGVVLSHDEYMKKVKKSQKWSSFWVALGEAGAASNAGYSSSQTYSNSSGYGGSSGYSSGYFGNQYGSVSANVRTYGNVSAQSTTYNYDATANYYAQQNARNNVASFNREQYLIRESIDQGYLKANTIFPEQRINGYLNIVYRKGEMASVAIKLKNETYTFVWNSGKK